MIGLGAKTLVVPGNLPIGCVPRYLTIFKSDNKEEKVMRMRERVGSCSKIR